MYRSERTETGPGGFTRVDTADHFSDVLDFIRRERIRWPENECASLQTREPSSDSDGKRYGIKSWAGTDSLDDAIVLAQRGWEQGQKLLSESLDAANIVQKQARVLAEGLDVAGYNPFVPAAVAGDPLCMSSGGLDRAKTKPIFRIMVSASISYNVSVDTIINRGAAILSWIDKLESVGYQCELLCVASFTGSGYNSTHLCFGFPMKAAGEPINIDRAAFMLAHPAMLRRILFALYERHEDCYAPFRSGYGGCCDFIPPQLQTDHSIYFPAMVGTSADWKNPATAILAVERAILKALTHEGVDEDIREQMEWAAS